MIVKNLNQKSDLRFFRIPLFLLFFLSTSYSFAQKFEDPAKIGQATVVLKDGAKIFSTDEAFNKQISSNAVVLQNADLVPQNDNSTKVLEAQSSKPEILKKDFKKEVEASVEKKQKEEIKKVEKEIKKHEKRKGAFRKFDFHDFPSSSQFLSSNSPSKNYIAPSHNDNDFSKIYVLQKDYSTKRALDFLHSAKYTHCNNSSLDYCFSLVYSVRPPPFVC